MLLRPAIPEKNFPSEFYIKEHISKPLFNNKKEDSKSQGLNFIIAQMKLLKSLNLEVLLPCII